MLTEFRSTIFSFVALFGIVFIDEKHNIIEWVVLCGVLSSIVEFILIIQKRKGHSTTENDISMTTVNNPDVVERNDDPIYENIEYYHNMNTATLAYRNDRSV